MCSVPVWERAQAAKERMAGETEQAQRLRDLRDKLCMLLEDSDLYNAKHVLEQIGSTELWDEQVVLHSKVRAAITLFGPQAVTADLRATLCSRCSPKALDCQSTKVLLVDMCFSASAPDDSFALGLAFQGSRHSAVLYDMGVSFFVKIMEAQTRRVIAYLMRWPA